MINDISTELGQSPRLQQTITELRCLYTPLEIRFAAHAGIPHEDRSAIGMDMNERMTAGEHLDRQKCISTIS